LARWATEDRMEGLAPQKMRRRTGKLCSPLSFGIRGRAVGQTILPAAAFQAAHRRAKFDQSFRSLKPLLPTWRGYSCLQRRHSRRRRFIGLTSACPIERSSTEASSARPRREESRRRQTRVFAPRPKRRFHGTTGQFSAPPFRRLGRDSSRLPWAEGPCGQARLPTTRSVSPNMSSGSTW
jgi:hypothetical protein